MSKLKLFFHVCLTGEKHEGKTASVAVSSGFSSACVVATGSEYRFVSQHAFQTHRHRDGATSILFLSCHITATVRERTRERVTVMGWKIILRLIPCLYFGKRWRVFSFCHVSPQVCFGFELHVAAMTSTLKNLPLDETDQFPLPLEI